MHRSDLDHDERPVPLDALDRPATNGTPPASTGPGKGGDASPQDDAGAGDGVRGEATAPPHGPSPRVSAGAVTDAAMLHPTSVPPEGGWRRVVWRLTAGRVTPAPSAAQQATRRLTAAAATPVAGSQVIATVSTKGGVGKTTTTLNLGHTFASGRGDRVVALDGNPDAGSLGWRLRRDSPATARDVLADAERIVRYADLRAYTSQADSRLEVFAAPDDPRVSTALDDGDYRALLELLACHFQLLLVDCGTGILDAATRGIVAAADQLVVVTGPSVDAARATAFLLDWLDSHGHAHLVAGAVAVVNAVPTKRGLVDVDKVAGHFAARCRQVVRVPWDRQLAAGAATGLDRLAPATRDAYLELAAAVAGGFTTNPPDTVEVLS